MRYGGKLSRAEVFSWDPRNRSWSDRQFLMWLRKQSLKLYSTLPYKSWFNEVIILDWNRLLCKFEGIKSNNGYKFHSSYDSTPSIPDGTFGTSFYRCAGRRIAHCGPGLESSSQCVPSRRVAPQRKNDEHIGHNADESIIYSIWCIHIYIVYVYGHKNNQDPF